MYLRNLNYYPMRSVIYRASNLHARLTLFQRHSGGAARCTPMGMTYNSDSASGDALHSISIHDHTRGNGTARNRGAAHPIHSLACDMKVFQ